MSSAQRIRTHHLFYGENDETSNNTFYCQSHTSMFSASCCAVQNVHSGRHFYCHPEHAACQRNIYGECQRNTQRIRIHHPSQHSTHQITWPIGPRRASAWADRIFFGAFPFCAFLRFSALNNSALNNSVQVSPARRQIILSKVLQKCKKVCRNANLPCH